MQALANLSRGMLAFIIISVGIFLIVASNPPPTVCDSQYEHFETKTKGILFIDKKLKVKPTKTKFVLSFERCRAENSIGGCYEFFVLLKDILLELNNTPETCYSDFGGRAVIKETLTNSMELATRLAWGAKPPSNYREAPGWFETPNLVIFCDLKEKYTQFYGKNALPNYAKKLIPQLPGAGGMSFNSAWPLSMLAFNCQSIN